MRATRRDRLVAQAHNPAGQLISRSASNPAYEWPYAQTFSESYVANGLNQYTNVAGQGLTYDGRGNTTNDTTKTYVYDSSNRLTSASNGAVATKDPRPALLAQPGRGDHALPL